MQVTNLTSSENWSGAIIVAGARVVRGVVHEGKEDVGP